jgi:hypothetical protein
MKSEKINIGSFEATKYNRFVSVKCYGHGFKYVPDEVLEYAEEFNYDFLTINWGDNKGTCLSYILLGKRY